MKQIDLRSITFYILNLEKDTDKRKFMEGQLRELGFSYQFVRGVKTDPGVAGIALSHLKALRLAGNNLPFCILEDDCRIIFDRVEEEFALPDLTDGFYLGHSHFGTNERQHKGVKWGKSQSAKYQVYDEKYLRIESMLARHGILFLTEQFRQAAMQANLDALCHFEYNYPADLAYARIQADHLILAPHRPWCYQSEIFNGNWMATKNSLLETVPL